MFSVSLPGSAPWPGLGHASRDLVLAALVALAAGRRPRVGADHRAARAAAEPGRPARLLVAHRRRPRPPDRGVHRHVEEPPARLPRLPGDAALVRGRLPAAPGGAHRTLIRPAAGGDHRHRVTPKTSSPHPCWSNAMWAGSTRSRKAASHSAISTM